MNQSAKTFFPIKGHMLFFGGIFCLMSILSCYKQPQDQFAGLLKRHNITKPNLVLITLDTTRADHLECYGNKKIKNPHLNAMVKKSILFKNCTVPCPFTLPSHCSMMTGLYPAAHGIRLNGNNSLSDQHHTLAEYLSRHGYDCSAFIAAYVLDRRWGLKQGFDFYQDYFDLNQYDQIDLASVQKPANEVIDSAISRLSESKKTPFFQWIHLFDPHAPYAPPEPYYSNYRHNGDRSLYDGEIAFVDEQVGRYVQWLKSNELLDNTIIAVIGDHGEGLGDHGESAHGYYIYDYAILVPFFIMTPLKPLHDIQVNAAVSSVDIFATLLEIAGIEKPINSQSNSLLPLFFNPQKEPEGNFTCSEALSCHLQYGWAPLYSLRTNQYKYIEAPKPELYNLVQDPGELVNIIDQFPKMAENFKQLLTEFIKTSSQAAIKPETVQLDKETIKKLASLGYLGTSLPKLKNQPQADPKDKLETYKTIEKAGQLVLKKEYAPALTLLSDLQKTDPNIPQARLLLAACLQKLNKPLDAKIHLQAVLENDPDNILAMHSLAEILANQGENESAISFAKKIIGLDPKNLLALTLLSEIYLKENDYANALPYLDHIYQIQPNLSQNNVNYASALVGLKQYQKAETVLQNLIKTKPKFPMANFYLGLLHEEQHQFDKACRFYQEEFSAHENCINARFNYASLQFNLGNKSEAIAHLRKITAIDPKFAKAYLFLARGLLSENEDLTKILKIIHHGLSLTAEAKQKALGYYLLADIYARQNDPVKLNNALNKAKYYQEQTGDVP